MIYLIRSLSKLAVVSLWLTACNSPDPEFNEPLIPQRVTFSATRLYPEGIAYAPNPGRFLVSSITQGKVGTVDEKGHYADFIKDNQLISAIGMKVYDGRLYVCNGDQGVSEKSTPQTTLKTAGLFIYDLTSGQNVRRINLAALLPTMNHYANDIAFDAKGNAYVTDSFAPVIYIVPADTTRPGIFIQSPLFAQGEGINLNGIVYHPDNYLLVVKANEGILYKIPLINPYEFKQIKGINVPGGDGLLLYNNDLYVVNNRNRVSQLRSTDKWETATLVKTDSVGYDQATTNVVAEDKIYTLNARIGEVNAAIAAKNPSLLQASTYSIQQFK